MRVVGITSGASAPEELVQRLVGFFRERGTHGRRGVRGRPGGRPLHAPQDDPPGDGGSGGLTARSTGRRGRGPPWRRLRSARAVPPSPRCSPCWACSPSRRHPPRAADPGRWRLVVGRSPGAALRGGLSAAAPGTSSGRAPGGLFRSAPRSPSSCGSAPRSRPRCARAGLRRLVGDPAWDASGSGRLAACRSGARPAPRPRRVLRPALGGLDRRLLWGQFVRLIAPPRRSIGWAEPSPGGLARLDVERP